MKSVALTTNALNNPLKYTDPTGYQTASAPGVVSWLDGGGGWGENGRGFAGNTNWNYFVPNTCYYKYYGNYDYVTYNWSTGYYEHHTLGGTEEESFDDVNRNIILPNAAVTITDIIWVGPDQNPYEYVSYWVNGKRWNSADGFAALKKMIDVASSSGGWMSDVWDWTKEHGYAGVEGEITYGAQLAGGVKKD